MPEVLILRPTFGSLNGANEPQKHQTPFIDIWELFGLKGDLMEYLSCLFYGN